MKIAQKLGLLVGALLAAVLITVLVLSAQIATTSREYKTLIKGDIEQRETSRTMLVVFGRQVLAFQQILLQARTSDDYTRLKKEYDQENTTVDQLNKELLANVGAKDPRLKTTLIEFQSSHAAVGIQYRAALDAFVASRFTDISGVSASVEGLDKFPNDLVTIVADYRTRSVAAAIASQNDAVTRRLRFIYAGGALLFLLAAGAAAVVVGGVVRPVRALTSAALTVANERLPKVVDEIASLPPDAPAPSLPRFRATSRDELAELASALSTLQDSAVGLALQQRRNEEVNTETLVNLGRRNQSLLTRMLSYVTELEQGETDPDSLDKLFRLDHLTTRIRRNAESLLVLAGAKQTRSWSHPISVADVLRAALSEIEEYNRVTVHHLDHAKVHGAVAADLTHMLAELLENGTRFSPRERQVLVVGRLIPGGYQFDLVDAGLGMSQDELATANERIAGGGRDRPDTKILGHHVVARIATRRDILVRLMPSDQIGITAQVLVPAVVISDADIPSTFHEMTQVPMLDPAPVEDPEAAPALAPAPVGSGSRTQPIPPYPATSSTPYPQAASAPARTAPSRTTPSRTTAAEPMPGRRPVRRVRGAQLGDLKAQEQDRSQNPVDPDLVRSRMASLQSGVAAARRHSRTAANGAPENVRPPASQPPVTGPTGPPRRVRGAQLAELAEPAAGAGEPRGPARDPAAIGRQLSGLQAATDRATRETGRVHATDDHTLRRNA